MSNEAWKARCFECGWRGLSSECHGGQPIADTGGHGELLCPKCESNQIDEPIAECFQADVQDWMVACFGETLTLDRVERNYRFLEEALELVQATGLSEDEVHALVSHVYSKPSGELSQEVGGRDGYPGHSLLCS